MNNIQKAIRNNAILRWLEIAVNNVEARFLYAEHLQCPFEETVEEFYGDEVALELIWRQFENEINQFNNAIL